MYVFNKIKKMIENIPDGTNIDDKYMEVTYEKEKVIIAWYRKNNSSDVTYARFKTKSEIFNCLKSNAYVCVIEYKIQSKKFTYFVRKDGNKIELTVNTIPDSRNILIGAYNDVVKIVEVDSVDNFNVTRENGVDIKEKFGSLIKYRNMEEFNIDVSGLCYISIDRKYNKIFAVTNVNTILINRIFKKVGAYKH